MVNCQNILERLANVSEAKAKAVIRVKVRSIGLICDLDTY